MNFWSCLPETCSVETRKRSSSFRSSVACAVKTRSNQQASPTIHDDRFAAPIDAGVPSSDSSNRNRRATRDKGRRSGSRFSVVRISIRTAACSRYSVIDRLRKCKQDFYLGGGGGASPTTAFTREVKNNANFRGRRFLKRTLPLNRNSG